MAVQDLTPQLRTRLSQVERAVGWFVILATFLLLGGFAYYVYHTAKQKGWFLTKIPYWTYVRDAVGLKEGDKVRLMGRDVGEITQIVPTDAADRWCASNNYNMFVQFRIVQPYYGYIWSDSRVRITGGDFLGNRVLEVMRGSTGVVSVVKGKSTRVLNKNQTEDWVLLEDQPQGWWIPCDESPALGERLEQIANRVERALPMILGLTNQLTGILSNSARLLAQMNGAVDQARPALSNLTLITSFLTNSQGALGDWLIPTNVHRQLAATLAAANLALTNADTNITWIAGSLDRTLENLANLTSNLNAQVQTNDKILAQISGAVIHADELMQGLKRHWLLRSAFKEKATNESRTRPQPQSRVSRQKP